MRAVVALAEWMKSQLKVYQHGQKRLVVVDSTALDRGYHSLQDRALLISRRYRVQRRHH